MSGGRQSPRLLREEMVPELGAAFPPTGASSETSDVAALLILAEHRMQTRQAGGMGGEEAGGEETSRLGLTHHCPGTFGG